MREAMQKARGRGDNSEFMKQWNDQTDGDGGLLAAYDSDYRNKVLDIEGVAAEVLFPDADVLGTGRISASPFGSGLAGGAGNAPELALAGAKAHNRWLADFCKLEPHRRIGVALIPILYDIDAAVAEIEAAREMGLRGIMIPTRWFDQPAYHDPVYDRVWAAARGQRHGDAHPLGCGPRRLRRGPRHDADLRDRGLLVGGAPAVGAAVGGRLRALPGAAGTWSPRTARGGPSTCCSRWTTSGSGRTTPPSSATSSARS